MERNERKTRIGTVVSDKMDKTIVVAVETFVKSFTANVLKIQLNLKLTMN